MNSIFSIITVTFNAEDKIEKTIKSIVKQDINLWEYIVIDGASTDRTIEIIEAYKNIYPNNIKYISEVDNGIYDAMNKGIALAQGEYLNFQGAGDTLIDGILNEIKGKLSYDLEIIYGRIFLEKSKCTYGRKFDTSTIIINHMPHQAMFYHKSVFNRVGKYPTKYSILGDHIYNIRCFGDSKIKKKFIENIVANFEEDGISSWGADIEFVKDEYNQINKYLGKELAFYYKTCGIEFKTLSRYSKNGRIITLKDEGALAEHFTQELVQCKERLEIIGNFNTKLENLDIITSLIKENPHVRVVIEDSQAEKLLLNLIDKGVPVRNIVVYKDIILTKEFIDFITRIYQFTKIYFFGSGEGSKRTITYIKSHIKLNNISILGIMDNNPKKWGEVINGCKIFNPLEVDVKSDEYIIITSMWHIEITKQLLEKGISKEQIILAY